MLVLHSATHVEPKNRGAVIAIGNFDGVHRGHQALIATTIREARRLKKPAGIMVFEPHPREHFQPHEPHFHLTPLNEKLRVFRAAGVDLAVVVAFDANVAALTPDAFIERLLVAGLGVSHVVIGYDFFFGKGRAGTPEMMRQAGREMNFGVSVVAPVAEAGEVFSSSAIRLKLAQGDVASAAHDLSRWWRVSGKVIGGAKRGTGLGFPTANVPMPKGTALGHGIYAVRAFIGQQKHDAAAYLGTRPTFDDGMPVLEVFLFDFDGDLYGREISVEFIGFIRADRKFESAEALKAQMALDVAEARRMLAAAADKPS